MRPIIALLVVLLAGCHRAYVPAGGSLEVTGVYATTIAPQSGDCSREPNWSLKTITEVNRVPGSSTLAITFDGRHFEAVLRDNYAFETRRTRSGAGGMNISGRFTDNGFTGRATLDYGAECRVVVRLVGTKR